MEFTKYATPFWKAAGVAALLDVAGSGCLPHRDEGEYRHATIYREDGSVFYKGRLRESFLIEETFGARTTGKGSTIVITPSKNGPVERHLPNGARIEYKNK